MQRRHNEIGIAIRDCLIEAGHDAVIRGGPVFDSHRGRPADIWVADHPAHRGGMAIDVTAVTTAGWDGGGEGEGEEVCR